MRHFHCWRWQIYEWIKLGCSFARAPLGRRRRAPVASGLTSPRAAAQLRSFPVGLHQRGHDFQVGLEGIRDTQSGSDVNSAASPKPARVRVCVRANYGRLVLSGRAEPAGCDLYLPGMLMESQANEAPSQARLARANASPISASRREPTGI